jgi:hypothetical protein
VAGFGAHHMVEMLTMAFQMSYGPEPEIEIKEAAN